MMYVFDTNAFSQLFHSYYRGRFPSLWGNFDELVVSGLIISTREVYREIEDDRVKSLRDWGKDNKELFPVPTVDEAVFVAQIFAEKRFQQIIEQKKILKGGKNADPFVIARAATVEGGAVVTMEKFKKNGTKIPNICKYFNVDCMDLEEFMEAEGWKF